MFNFFETGGKGTSDIAKSQIKCFCYSNLTTSIKYSVCDFVWSGWDIKYSFARFVVLQLAEFCIAVLCIDMMQTGDKLRCTALAWSSFITNTHSMLISIFTTRQFTWKPGWITHYLLVSQWKFFLQANLQFSKTTTAQNHFLPSGKFVVSFESTVMEGLMIQIISSLPLWSQDNTLMVFMYIFIVTIIALKA